MNFKLLICLILFLCFFSCSKNKNDLFFINDYEDLIFMAESTNVKKIDKNSSDLLYDSEKESKNYIFKSFGKIYENNTYEAYIIFHEMKIPELSYSFSIRTFNKKNHKIIDNFYLSGYGNDSGIFCSGSINKENIIIKECDDGGDGSKIKAKMDINGKFIILP